MIRGMKARSDSESDVGNIIALSLASALKNTTILVIFETKPNSLIAGQM